MPTVDENRLKGNYGATCVALRLSSECLVRPVAADTDVGVDLYCESVEEGMPFLHFWVQVKAGAQCQLSQNLRAASCSFNVNHLEYWSRQPVPVFAALVPVGWPVQSEPNVYIIDITSQLLAGLPTGVDSVTLKSDYIWHASNREDVQRFLAEAIPASVARLQCRNGVVASMPTLRPNYVVTSPSVPVFGFRSEILTQLRRTAALSVMFLCDSPETGDDSADFRRILASIVAQFGDDPHWENFMAQALSYHADRLFDQAIEFYSKAIQCIQNDPKVRNLEAWQTRMRTIEQLCGGASRGEDLNFADYK